MNAEKDISKNQWRLTGGISSSKYLLNLFSNSKQFPFFSENFVKMITVDGDGGEVVKFSIGVDDEPQIEGFTSVVTISSSSSSFGTPKDTRILGLKY